MELHPILIMSYFNLAMSELALMTALEHIGLTSSISFITVPGEEFPANREMFRLTRSASVITNPIAADLFGGLVCNPRIHWLKRNLS